MNLPEFRKLVYKLFNHVFVTCDHHVLVVPCHSGLGPIEGPIEEDGGVNDNKLVMHVMLLLPSSNRHSQHPQSVNLQCSVIQ